MLNEHKPEVMVYLGKGEIGHQFGDFFDLGDLLSPQGGLDSFSDLYIRTASNNIYKLDTSFELVNLRESVRLRKVHTSLLLPEYLIGKRGIIRVGSSFDYYVSARDYGSPPEQANMSNVVEIVATRNRKYSPDRVAQLCGRRESTILTEYQKGMREASTYMGRPLSN